MSVRLLRLSALAAALLPSAGAAAQVFCSEPLAPACVDLGSTFDSPVTVGDCSRDLERYRQEMTTYVQCLRQAADEAAAQADRLTRQFNCRSGTRTDCGPAPQEAKPTDGHPQEPAQAQ